MNGEGFPEGADGVHISTHPPPESPVLVFSSLMSLALAAGDASELTVSINKRKAKIRSVLSYSHGEQARTVVLSSESLTCEELEDRPAQRETRLRIVVAPVLATDGTSTWTTTELIHLPRNMRPSGSTAEPTATAGGVALELDIQHDEPADAFLELPAMRYALSGSVVAEDCGAQPIAPDATPRPQDGLSLTIAGQDIPIQAATLFSDRLILSSQPHGCHAITSDADFSLDVRLKDDAADMVLFSGARLPIQYTVGIGPSWGNALEAHIDGEQVTLEGALDMMGYPVTLSGTVSAQRCP